MTKKLFFLKVKKSGGSKESELKRKLESKSLLELLGMMDDVGKQKAADALKSVDPQQSLGISHLGLDGYLRKAFELLERGFPHMVGSGMTPDEKAELVRLRTAAENKDVEMSPEGKSRLEELEELEEEEELEKTSEYLGIKYAALNAELVSNVVTDKINALKSVFPQLAIEIESNVKTLKDVRHALDYRNALHGPSRDEMSENAYMSTKYSSNIVGTRQGDYEQYTENEAAGPLAEIISADSGKVITREQIENAPNILRYLGKNKKQQISAKAEIPPHITDPLDYDVIEHGGKIYVAEVKGKSKGKDNLIGVKKRVAFEKIIETIGKANPHTKVIPIILWPNEPPSRLTKSKKYYSHIPSYSYVVNPNWDSAPIFLGNPREKTYNFTNAKTIKNPRHTTSVAPTSRTTSENVEPETAEEKRERVTKYLSGLSLSQQERANVFNDFRRAIGDKEVKKEAVQNFMSPSSKIPDKDIQHGIYEYFLKPSAFEKAKATAAVKKMGKK